MASTYPRYDTSQYDNIPGGGVLLLGDLYCPPFRAADPVPITLRVSGPTLCRELQTTEVASGWTRKARNRRAAAFGALVLVTGFGLTACSSTGPSSLASTTTSASSPSSSKPSISTSTSTSTSATPSTSTTGASSAGSTSELSLLAAEINSSKKLTFTATYAEIRNSGSPSTTATWAQMPPQSVFKSQTSETLDT